MGNSQVNPNNNKNKYVVMNQSTVSNNTPVAVAVNAVADAKVGNNTPVPTVVINTNCDIINSDITVVTKPTVKYLKYLLENNNKNKVKKYRNYCIAIHNDDFNKLNNKELSLNNLIIDNNKIINTIKDNFKKNSITLDNNYKFLILGTLVNVKERSYISNGVRRFTKNFTGTGQLYSRLTFRNEHFCKTEPIYISLDIKNDTILMLFILEENKKNEYNIDYDSIINSTIIIDNIKPTEQTYGGSGNKTRKHRSKKARKTKKCF